MNDWDSRSSDGERGFRYYSRLGPDEIDNPWDLYGWAEFPAGYSDRDECEWDTSLVDLTIWGLSHTETLEIIEFFFPGRRLVWNSDRKAMTVYEVPAGAGQLLSDLYLDASEEI